MKKLSFKEYLESKTQLKQIAEETSALHVAEYDVKKYCKLVVSEHAKRLFVPLKPKSRILIEWLYANTKVPTPVSIRLENVKSVDPEAEHETPWKGERLLKWLIRNTIEHE